MGDASLSRLMITFLGALMQRLRLIYFWIVYPDLYLLIRSVRYGWLYEMVSQLHWTDAATLGVIQFYPTVGLATFD